MAEDVLINTKSGLRMEVYGPDEQGEHRRMHFQLDRVGAQFLARRLLQLAGNDREIPDPAMGEHVFGKSLTAHESKYPGTARVIKSTKTGPVNLIRATKD